MWEWRPQPRNGLVTYSHLEHLYDLLQQRLGTGGSGELSLFCKKFVLGLLGYIDRTPDLFFKQLSTVSTTCQHAALKGRALATQGAPNSDAWTLTGVGWNGALTTKPDELVRAPWRGHMRQNSLGAQGPRPLWKVNGRSNACCC